MSGLLSQSHADSPPYSLPPIPIASKDIDVLEDFSLARDCAAVLNARFLPLNRTKAAVPMNAVVRIGSNLTIDFQASSAPNSAKDIEDAAVKLPTTWGDVRVMHPFIKNTGSIALENLRFESAIKKAETLQVLERPPPKPLGVGGISSACALLSDFDCMSVEESDSVRCVRPGETYTRPPIYIGSSEDVDVEVPVTVFASTLSSPLQACFGIRVLPEKKYFSGEHDQLAEDSQFTASPIDVSPGFLGGLFNNIRRSARPRIFLKTGSDTSGVFGAPEARAMFKLAKPLVEPPSRAQRGARE